MGMSGSEKYCTFALYNKRMPTAMSNISIGITPQARAADVVMARTAAAKVFMLLDIGLGLGERTLADVARQHEFDTDALLDILRVTLDTEPGRPASSRTFIGSVLRFLRQSHLHFRSARIPALRAAIMGLEEGLPDRYGAMLSRFFDSYINDVDEHFRFEELTVFPYIEGLLGGQAGSTFSISSFSTNHTNIEQKLHDLKSILVKHLPLDGISPLCLGVLVQLSDLEADLNAHAAIEDAVLTPAVALLEQKGGEHV